MKNRVNKFLVTGGFSLKHRRGFKSGDFYYYNGMRATFEKALLFIQKPGRALDIGAGFGNETKELLKRGFDVVATDVNSDAVKYLKKLARKTHYTRTVLEVDEMGLPEIPEGRFDFIVCEMVLHFLDEDGALNSIQKIQDATEKGGINAISSYTESKSIREDPRLTGYFNYLLPPEKLKKLYKNWEILYYEEKSNIMGHPSARLIARKK